MKLTKRAIDNFEYEGNESGFDVRWDSSISGFGVRIYPSEKKSFVISYRANRRKRLFVIGQYGKITLEEARKIAQKRLTEVIEGKDPAKNKKDIANQKTINELCKSYLEKHAKLHKKTWKEDERRIKNNIIPKWNNRLVSSISKNDVISLYQDVGKAKPYEANRLLALLSKMFELAIDWEFYSEKAFNPAKRIKKFKEEKRDRWVTQEEMPRLAKAIDNEQNIYAKNAIWLYLYTGARKSELLNAKWEHINWNRKELRLPETKAGRMHHIPLCDEAIETLRKTPKTAGNPYIFAGKNEGKPLVDIKRAWLRIRKEAGLDDVRLHDLRRTVGSWLAQDGHSLHLIGNILNHSNQSTTAVYARFSENTAREAMESLGKKIRGVVEG